MPHEILESMRALREDMRRRLLQVPEYRALVSLDRSIDELCDILQGAVAQQPLRGDYPQPVAAPAAMPAPSAAPMSAPMSAPMTAPMPAHAPVAAPLPHHSEPAQPRAGGIANAFAETLAAKIDQRNLARASAIYSPPSHRALGG